MRAGGRAGGDAAERLALAYLERQGLTLLDRNFRCHGGEIDLIVQDGGTLVFVEVRQRRSPRFGTGAETVDRRKQKRIAMCAELYLARQGLQNRMPCRMDVVALDGDTHQPSVNWIRGAFELQHF